MSLKHIDHNGWPLYVSSAHVCRLRKISAIALPPLPSKKAPNGQRHTAHSIRHREKNNKNHQLYAHRRTTKKIVSKTNFVRSVKSKYIQRNLRISEWNSVLCVCCHSIAFHWRNGIRFVSQRFVATSQKKTSLRSIETTLKSLNKSCLTLWKH